MRRLMSRGCGWMVGCVEDVFVLIKGAVLNLYVRFRVSLGNLMPQTGLVS